MKERLKCGEKNVQAAHTGQINGYNSYVLNVDTDNKITADATRRWGKISFEKYSDEAPMGDVTR